jgi:CheY-like chemotaxis protein
MAESKYVIYVDDDEDDRMMLEESFKSFQNYKLKTFENGFELLEDLENKDAENYPCLIVLDINMPKLSGTDLLKLLKTNDSYKEIPVVMFTTGATPYNQLKFKELNTEVVGKPLTISSYNDVSKSLLGYCS